MKLQPTAPSPCFFPPRWKRFGRGSGGGKKPRLPLAPPVGEARTGLGRTQPTQCPDWGHHCPPSVSRARCRPAGIPESVPPPHSLPGGGSSGQCVHCPPDFRRDAPDTRAQAAPNHGATKEPVQRRALPRASRDRDRDEGGRGGPPTAERPGLGPEKQPGLRPVDAALLGPPGSAARDSPQASHANTGFGVIPQSGGRGNAGNRCVAAGGREPRRDLWPGTPLAVFPGPPRPSTLGPPPRLSLV